jgi:phosphatidylglycerophosphate synthase
MDSRTARRASTDAMAAVAAYGIAGVWLSAAYTANLEIRAMCMAAGTLVIGHATASILQRSPRRSTPADRVTLLRAVLVACCAVLTVPGLFTGRPPGPALAVVGTVAFLLDAVDGPVARRTGTASAAGARLDTGTDAALVLVLSCATAGPVGPWTLAIGLLYYAFVAAGRFRPHLRGPLPASPARKAIGAFQPFALLLALAPGVPPWLALLGPAMALPLLVVSFARDTAELERLHRRPPAETHPDLNHGRNHENNYLDDAGVP